MVAKAEGSSRPRRVTFVLKGGKSGSAAKKKT
jgi:hypothetical protein